MPTVILTATVRPQAETRLAVTDPAVRTAEYQRALRRWVQLAGDWPDLRLVLAENSGADLADLTRGLPPSDRLLLVPVPPPHAAVVTRGKGACEADLLEAVLPRIPGADAGDLILKCTGRLFVPNLRRVLPDNRDPRAVVVRATVDLSYVDARLVGATRAGWLHTLTGMAAEVDESSDRWLEHVLARRLALALASGTTVHRFHSPPRYSGRSGTHGGDYGKGRRLRAVLAKPLEAALRGPLSIKQF
ncbi:hypothetical protein FE374_04000 [Georgenia yuyongxinii]|uniref:Glycosyltransferase n=1 Tax=Georgenia yuyongxinii TaxID=2589797 RepID=A0A5B8C7K7_9MICO|nr:hypothetical protein [Georgenia yuyongxinii]QDC23906.1 hypothetical protein FE374_04000 [Georgenia yuyongxinii]